MLLRSASLLAIFLLATATQAQTSTAATEVLRSITVGGSGQATATPDKAELRLSVQKTDPSMDKARSEALAVVQRFLALTRKLGIPEARVRTTGATVRPDYRWDQPTSRQVLVGYMVQRELLVELHDLDKLGALVEGAVDAGVNHVSAPMLGSSKNKDLNREALAAAARDAEANARILAETLGVRLGKLRELSAMTAYQPRPPMPVARMAMAAAESADSGSASYMPGTLEVETSVTATFDVDIK